MVPSAARILRPLGLLVVLVAALILQEDTAAAADPPPFSILAVVFRGSGCRAPDDIKVRTKFEAGGGIMRVGFPTAFVAVAGANGKTVRVACNGVIPFSIDEGKRIGITQVRVAGRATIGSETSTALLTTEFFFPGERGPTMHERFLHADGSQVDFEYIQPTGTVWSKCGGKQSFRVNAALLASGVDAEIAMEEGNGNAEGFHYEVMVKDCVANPRQEL